MLKYKGIGGEIMFGSLKYKYDNGILTIISCPLRINEKSFSKIALLLKSDCVKEIVFQNKLKYISKQTFSVFPDLEKIVFEEFVYNADYEIFEECDKLEEIVINKSDIELYSIPKFYTKKISKITLPEGLIILPTDEFSGCALLKSIKLPSSLKVIERNVFENCRSLEEIEIPEGVEKIESFAFANCTSLKKVVLPSSLKVIKNGVFQFCNSLEEIEIPEGVEWIERFAFANCTLLKKVILPSSLKVIERNAFKNCRSLEEIEIPKGVGLIDEDAFLNCTSLKRVVLPRAFSEIATSAFKDCKSLEEIEIPEGAEKIEGFAFANFTSLKKVVLPSSLKVIKNDAFKWCDSLEEIEIPEGVERIDENAFANCPSLKKVVLPSSLKVIKKDVFQFCNSLEEIEIPEGVEKIESFAFAYCPSLKKVVLPSSLKVIKKAVFQWCDSLEEIEIPEGVEKIDENAFLSCTSLKRVVLPGAFSEIATSAFKDCKSLEEIKIVKNDDVVVIDLSHNKFIDNNLNCLFMKSNTVDDYKFYHNGEYHEFTKEELFRGNNFKLIGVYDERDYINLYYWNKKNKFIPHHSIVRNMPIEDIDMFYINNNYRKWAELIKTANMSEDINKGTLFKLCYVLGVFQKSTSKRDEAIEFIKKFILNKVSENQIHALFDGFDLKNGYDPMYAEFFMKYYVEDPYFMYDVANDVDLLAASYNNFKNVRKSYPHKIINTNREADVLLPEHVMSVVSNVIYEDVDDDNESLAILVGRYGYAEEQFEKLQDWFNQGKNIDEKDMKIFISADELEDTRHIKYELLEKDNPLNAVLGNITNCCQVIGGEGESCVEYGMSKPNSKFMIFHLDGIIIGQSWVWYDEKTGTVCLDNIEIPEKFSSKIAHNKDLQKSFLICVKRVAHNFVSEMKEHGLEVNNVTIGEGYNDIKDILSGEFESRKDKHFLDDYNGYSDADEQYVVFNKKR